MTLTKKKGSIPLIDCRNNFLKLPLINISFVLIDENNVKFSPGSHPDMVADGNSLRKNEYLHCSRPMLVKH